MLPPLYRSAPCVPHRLLGISTCASGYKGYSIWACSLGSFRGHRPLGQLTGQRLSNLNPATADLNPKLELEHSHRGHSHPTSVRSKELLSTDLPYVKTPLNTVPAAHGRRNCRPIRRTHGCDPGDPVSSQCWLFPAPSASLAAPGLSAFQTHLTDEKGNHFTCSPFQKSL